MRPSDPHTPLVHLTLAGFEEFMAEREEAHRHATELDRRLDAIKLLIGDDKFAELTSRVQPEERRPTWISLIEEILKRTEKGLTYTELKDEIALTPFGEDLEKSPNSFYNTIQRLIKAGRVIKWGERVYGLEAFDAAKLRGELESRTHVGVPDLVIRVLTNRGAMVAAKVVEAVEQEPEAAELLKRGTQGVYAALSRLSRRGDIVRTSEGQYLRENGGLL